MTSSRITTTAASAALLRVRSDMERVRRLTHELSEARDDFDTSVALAIDVDVPVAQLARHVGLSRESIYQALRRQDERQADAG